MEGKNVQEIYDDICKLIVDQYINSYNNLPFKIPHGFIKPQIVRFAVYTFLKRHKKHIKSNIEFAKNAEISAEKIFKDTESLVHELDKDGEVRHIFEEVRKLLPIVDKGNRQLVLFIIGAGVSFEADFDTKLLDEIIWKTVEGDYKSKGGRTKFDKEWKYQDAKNRIWEGIKNREDIYDDFKERFISAVDRRVPEKPHELLCRIFINKKRVIGIICLNWDDFIEKAAEQSDDSIETVVMFRDLNPNSVKCFWKPHGCVRFPGDPWILPHERPNIVDEINPEAGKFFKLHDSDPYIVICIGYSRNDESISREFCARSLNRPNVYSILPERSEKFLKKRSIEIFASEALALINSYLN